MVCSQVYSQHPSHCKFSNVHQYRYGAFSNAEVHCREPETSKADWVGNTTPDGHFMSSKGYACSGYASITSPFKSSWIQRLIPPHNTSVEQAQPSDKFNEDNHCIDVLQTNWKENAGHLTTLGNQSKFPVYENSRRTKQDFFMSHQTYSGTYTPECVPNGFITMPFEAPNALPPEIQVSPKPLPIVESLLPGYSKKVAENQTSTETNMSHMLSRGMELANPMKQTVHYSADEKSRVSCSSTERLNSHSVVRAAGDLLALNSSQMVQRCVVPSQPSSEFSFNSIGAFTQSNMDLTYGGKDMQTGTNVRMHKFKAQTYGLSLDQLPSPKTISKRNGCNPNKHHSCAHDGSETLYARDGSFDGGWWPNLNIEKDEPLVPFHHGVNVAKQKVGISFSQHMLEQDLGSLHGSHEEQGGTSRSFSFHIENRLASELDYAKLVARKGQWPFGPSTLSNEDLVQSRWSEDNRARGVAEVTRPGLPCDNSFIFQETGVCKAGTAYIGRSQSAPIFGMEKLNESSSPRISENHDVSPYKAACIDIGGVFTGEMNAQALPGNSVDHESASHRISDNHDVSPDKAARIDIGGVFTGEVNAQALPDNSVDQAGQTLQGGHPLDRLESNLMMEGVEGRELMLSFPSRTVSVENRKAFRPSLQTSTRKCSPEGACLNHTDGNCVSSNNWKAFKPPIRSRIYTCPPEGAQSNHADGNLCNSTGSIGSCSKRTSNLCSEDASTSADARSRPITQEKPSVALQKQLHSSQRQCAGFGVNTALDDRESEGREGIGWRASGSSVKQNIWIQRWSTMRSKKFQSVSRSNREGRVLAHARNHVEKDYCTSHGSRESSYHFDLRPAKRICYENRSGLLPGNISEIGSFSVGRGHTEKGVTSHFMERFFTPSAAAMAIMGMTAREVHATQPQSSSLFGVWASNASTRKPSGAQFEVCKEFCTRPDFKKEIPQSVNKRVVLS